MSEFLFVLYAHTHQRGVQTLISFGILRGNSNMQSYALAAPLSCPECVRSLGIMLCHSSSNHTARPCLIHTYRTVLLPCSQRVVMNRLQSTPQRKSAAQSVYVGDGCWAYTRNSTTTVFRMLKTAAGENWKLRIFRKLGGILQKSLIYRVQIPATLHSLSTAQALYCCCELYFNFPLIQLEKLLCQVSGR